MPSVRILLLCLLTFLLTSIGRAQGVVWDHTVSTEDSDIAVDTNGDIYLASWKFGTGTQLYLQMQRFAADGTLLGTTFGTTLPVAWTDAAIAGLAIRGRKLYIVSRLTYTLGQKSQFVVYDMDAQDFGANQPISDGTVELSVEKVAFSATYYCIMGPRRDAGNFMQKRRYSTNEVVHNISFADVPGDVVRRGIDNFVANRWAAGSPGSLTIMRIGTSVLTTTTTVPAADFLKLYLNEEQTTAYSVGMSGTTLYVRPFSFFTTAFTLPLTVTTAEVKFVRGIGPSGDTGCTIAYATLSGAWLARCTPMSISTANVGPLNPGLAGFARDGDGHTVVLFAWYTEKILRAYRVRSTTGAVMNRVDVPTSDPVGAPRGLHLDASGNLKFLYIADVAEPIYERHLVQVNPAALTIPGPYTVGGDMVTAQITLDQPAPAGGATFSLYSNNAAVTVPTSVTIPGGNASTTFPITTVPVGANAKPVINARFEGLNLQANFDLAAPLMQSVTASPQVQYGGLNIVGTLRLTGDAPTGGKVVMLSSSNPLKATVPASTTVAAGVDAKTFIITTVPTLANASSVITATTGSVSKTVFIAVNAPILLTAVLAQTSIQGGTNTTLTPTLNAPAPNGYTVALISGAPSFVQLPSTFAIPSGATSVGIPVTTSDVTTTMIVTLVAYRGPYVKTMTLTLTP